MVLNRDLSLGFLVCTPKGTYPMTPAVADSLQSNTALAPFSLGGSVLQVTLIWLEGQWENLKLLKQI